LTERRVLAALQHEIHGDRQEDGPRWPQPRLQEAALQRDRDVVNAGHFVGVFRSRFGEAGVRRTKNGIVDEESRILLPVDHEQRDAGHERVTHVEHAVGKARIRVQAHDGRLAGHQSVARGDPDGARFVEGEDVGRLGRGHGGEKSRLGRARVAEDVGNLERLEKVLDQLAAGSLDHTGTSTLVSSTERRSSGRPGR
jgi:hypothetical protein